MSTLDQWYYVEGNERVGPIDEKGLSALIKNGKLGPDNFVWKKGFDNWKKLSEVKELGQYLSPEVDLELDSLPALPSDTSINWKTLNREEKLFTIKIGSDRGSREDVEYGPYSLSTLKKAFDENRINGKTYIFVKGLPNWMFLADLPIFEEVFQDVPPKIEDKDRRKHVRKPFVARVFFHNQSKFFEGICRDISVGGMQMLIGEFPGQVGDEVDLNVHPDNSDYNFVAHGKIVRKLEGGQGISIRFQTLGQEANRSIDKYVKQFS